MQKRRTAYIIIALVVLAVVGTGVFFTVRYFSNGGVSGKGKNAAVSRCVMPYNRNNCASAKNSTVKKIQEMLKRKGYYNDTADGNFGPKTQTAVKNFQKSQGVSQDGSVGPDTLKRLAKATNTQYYEISYNANGGSGSLNYNGGFYTGAWNNKQIILKGVSTALSNGKFTKSGYNHVGYKSSANGAFYYIGQNVSSFPYTNITLYAVYCPAGQIYNPSTGSCKGGNTSTVTTNQVIISSATCLANGTLQITASQKGGDISKIVTNGKTFNVPETSVNGFKYTANYKKGNSYSVTVYGSNNISKTVSVGCPGNPVISSATCTAGGNLKITARQPYGDILKIVTNGKTFNVPETSANGFVYGAKYAAKSKNNYVTVYGLHDLKTQILVSCN